MVGFFNDLAKASGVGKERAIRIVMEKRGAFKAYYAFETAMDKVEKGAS
jgi:hypothetical protein